MHSRLYVEYFYGSVCPSPSQLNVERRLFTFRFGDPQARMNWVHVDNLVTAHVLAAEGLAAHRNRVSVSRRRPKQTRMSWLPCMFTPPPPFFYLCIPLQSGQVYFINDGVSVNVFEWLTPLVSRTAALVSDVSPPAGQILQRCSKV